jgi:hypothetical protein
MPVQRLVYPLRKGNASAALAIPRQLAKNKVEFTIQYPSNASHFYLVPVVAHFIVRNVVGANLL